MAAALLRRGSGLCVRCIHRELCRVVWRPQTALFTTKPSDRKQPRRTHIKKAKPQPAVDVATLLEQLFSQSRPGTTPPAGKAPPAKASSTPTKPPSAFSVKVSTSHAPPLSKTEPAVSAFPAASSFKQVDADSVSNVTVPTTPAPAAPLRSEAAATECQTSAETVETKVETAQKLSTAAELPLSVHMVERNIETSSVPAAPVEPLIETTIESPVEPVLSPVETLQVRAAVLDAPAEDVQTSSTDSGVVNVSHTAKEELLTETIESPVEVSHFPVETLETAAAVGGPVEPTIDVAVDVAAEKVETDSGVIDIPHTATVEPSLEMTVEPSVEASASPLETRESRAAVAECAVEPTVDATVDAQAEQTSSTDSGEVNASYGAKEEALIEATIEPAVEASSCLVSEGTVETEAAVSLSHSALIQNAQESAPFPLNNERTVESGSVNVAVEEEGMTLESVTLRADKLLVASLQTDELLQTKSVLDEKAEKQLQELLAQTEIERKAAAETESSSEDEGEILTDVLSTWDSLSDDLQELEGESGALVAELLCSVPAALSKTASDPPVGANGEQTEDEAGEAEAMTLESITLAKVKAEFGGLETEVLLEARDALEKEADALAKEEKMEVTPTAEDAAVSEDTTEDEILTLDSISEATDALEAETSVILEAMFGSEQGPRQPLADQKLERQIEATGVEAEKEPKEQEGSVLEAMSLESVTLAEVEASLGTLENECLSDIADYLEKEAEIVAGERRVEGDADAVASEETTEALKMESLPEADALSEDLQIDALMEELLLTGFTEGSIGQDVVRADILDATVATGSVDVDTAAPVTDDLPASPALKEVLQGQEEEEEGAQTDALGIRDDLDPVQRLFLEKIKEYSNMRRLNGGLLEAEPDYEKYLSEETAKLQRLYGGGDLSSFPQFTFTEPDMDQDSK